MLAILSDKFKGTLTSVQAAEAISAGLRLAWPEAECAIAPMADGGEGTAEALGAVLHPSGLWYELPGGEAYVPSCGEGTVWLDSLSGGCLKDRSTLAIGEAIRSALDSGLYRRIYVGIGGTKTADGGLGMLRGMGYRVHTAADGTVESIDAPAGQAAGRYRDAVVGMADVSAPLIADGRLSAMSFIAQKGATGDDEEYIRRLFTSLTRLCGRNARFGGAGGGIGFALEAVAGCRCGYGARLVLERALSAMPRPAMLITGEGRIDSQTSGGKVVDTVYRYGAAEGIPVAAFAGCREAGTAYPHTYACTAPGAPLPADPAAALARTAAAAAPALRSLLAINDNTHHHD